MKKYSVKKTERIYTPLQNFSHLLSICEERGDRVLFKYRTGKEYATLSYGDFAALSRSIAAGLSAEGLAGKRIAVIGETSPQWVATYLAVVSGGGVIVPMDKELAVSEIEGFLASVEAEAIVYSASFTKKFEDTINAHPTIKKFIPISYDGEENDKILPLDVLCEKGKEALANGYTFPQRAHDELAVMLFTSGTTGTSKCVMLSEKNICSCVNAACATVNFSPDDVTLSVLPLHHTYELAIMLASLSYGLMVGINDTLPHLMANLKEIRPTGLVLVPLFVSTMHKRIMAEAKKQKKDKLMRRMIPVSNGLRRVGIDLRRKFFGTVIDSFGGRLNKIICGGAPLNPEMVRDFEAFGIQICEGYGITECSPLISVSPYFDNRPGSVGPASPSCTVRIATTGKNAKGFDEGEIQVKGDNVMLGYYNNPEANASSFTEDGWYRTGDVGYLDRDGYIYITGRLKSVIVLENGKNVFPEEIEEYLENISEIAESVVLGRKAPDSDAVVLTAIVFPNRDMFPQGTDNDTIYKTIYAKIQEQNKHMPSFKKIMALELRDVEFEKTTSRKIKRHLVK